jgi:serine/threonine protein kinase/alpha-tubulin suppressor-like RCC1 family protein
MLGDDRFDAPSDERRPPASAAPSAPAGEPTVGVTQHRPVDGFDGLSADYELLGELGRGGSAVVYRARDRRLGREVALKVVRVPPALAAGGDEPIARLAREARTIARLEHPHIVRVHAVRELRDGLALEMPCIAGRTLKQLLAEEGPLDAARATAILRDVAAALAFAHAHGVVHRDVKPENIFVETDTGHALLADFGVARSEDVDTRLTQTGVTLGTPAYMSPEQIDGHGVDGRSDLYSLGLVGWEMLTGRRPWEGEGLFAVLQRQKHDELPPVEVVRPAGAPAVPAQLLYIVERMLQKAPSARWAGADAVAAQLAHPVLPADFAQWKRAHQRRVTEARRTPGLAARGAALVGAALTTMRLRRPAADPSLPPTDDAPAVATPTWASDEERRRPGRRVAVGAAALVLAGMAALAAQRDRGSASVPLAPADSLADRPTSVAVPLPGPAVAAASELPATAAVPPSEPGGRAPDARAGEVVADSAPVSAPVPAPLPTPRVAAREPLATPTITPRGVEPAARSTPPTALAVPSVPAPAPVAPAAARIAAVSFERTAASAGGRHSCAILPGDGLACWGANADGQLGTGDLESREEPTAVQSDVRFAQVAAGGSHSCALTTDGSAYCWGDGERGQLGTGARAQRATPARVAGVARFRGLRAGLAHTCGIAADGAVLCWGANDRGQLGDGQSGDRAAPAAVGALRAASLTVGWRHSCALTADGAAYCWGENADGQLGDGSRSARRTPTLVGGGQRFVAIAAGAAHTCAVAGDGRAFCWGRNAAGQLGTGSTTAELLPTPVETSARFAAIVTGSTHSCGRSGTGLVFCWGGNAYGQLGDGSTTGQSRPVRVAGGPYAALSASGAHTCAMLDGATVCWGYNVDGQLGDGTRAHRSSPMRVSTAAH